MIQRVQSICLLLSSIFYFLYWFFGYKWYEKGYVFFQQQLVTNIDTNVFKLIFDVTSLIPILISLITFLFNIFIYQEISSNKVSQYCILFKFIYASLHYIVLFYYIILLG